MAIVKWAVHEQNPNVNAHLIKTYTDYAPKKVLTILAGDEARAYTQTAAGTDYRQCFAFVDYMRNVYQLPAPFDIRITIETDGRVSRVETPSSTSARIVLFRSDPSASTNILLSLMLQYTFYSSDSVMVEQIAPFMDYELSKQGVALIPGTFNIGKWVRPVEFALEIAKGTREVYIKQGTPLCYVRFVPEDGSVVTLKEVTESEELQKVIATCSGLKFIQAKTPLAKCYEKAKKFVDAFLRPSRCPFRRNKSV